MFPIKAFTYVIDGMGMDFKMIRYFSWTYVLVKKFSYFKNIISREFGSSYPFPKSMSFFPNRIQFIFESCSKKKVRRVNANLIITAMQDEQSFRDFSIMKNPRITMRKDAFPFVRKLAVFITSEYATFPNPTIRGFSDVLKESFFGLFSHEAIV